MKSNKNKIKSTSFVLFRVLHGFPQGLLNVMTESLSDIVVALLMEVVLGRLVEPMLLRPGVLFRLFGGSHSRVMSM